MLQGLFFFTFFFFFLHSHSFPLCTPLLYTFRLSSSSSPFAAAANLFLPFLEDFFFFLGRKRRFTCDVHTAASYSPSGHVKGARMPAKAKRDICSQSTKARKLLFLFIFFDHFCLWLIYTFDSYLLIHLKRPLGTKLHRSYSYFIYMYKKTRVQGARSCLLNM